MRKTATIRISNRFAKTSGPLCAIEMGTARRSKSSRSDAGTGSIAKTCA